MQRDVTSSLSISLGEPATLVLSVAVHGRAPLRDERLEITDGEGTPLPYREIVDHAAHRLHRIETDVRRIEVRYSATIEGLAASSASDDHDRIVYARPSRYCESDALGPSAAALFGGLRGFALLDAVVDWVAGQLRYVPGSSLPTDGARDTYLKRQGVCRDYAHLVIALLRARDMPARLASVYAPGLVPMDFHAVVEACVDGEWYVVDATRLAPRALMQRIATGRDAADTAFLSNTLSRVRLQRLAVDATASDVMVEDPSARVQLR